ncbi:hypothetical protein [Aurantiacibacter gilvus]|uniref:Uncharacterized protein n=1 Tax=Aurantiacibacter gilvus TaxID=3139141 RepID=A0ABU9IGL8_9SPHN
MRLTKAVTGPLSARLRTCHSSANLGELDVTSGRGAVRTADRSDFWFGIALAVIDFIGERFFPKQELE